ncbi:hypothetical protein J437_LFUL001719 [Ladona fulva]|uniref:C2H2-type domain-containing protein n=1 Tax=Ladona fulva TaxID=123851 RepID=A0A8K0K141_LADFU|nr:hypothetical protein J437_LFUL001719 [Ladona fulva]
MDYTCSSDSTSNFPSKNEGSTSQENGNEKDSEKNDKEVEEEDMFQCSCGMMFKSIIDHLMKYHSDEEVIVKGTSDQLETLLNPVALEDLVSKDQADVVAHEVTIQDAESTPSSTVEEPEVIVCDRDNPVEEKKESTTPLQKVQIDQLEGKVEECVDKDGRLYLRKFVRVEKFWSEKDEIKAAKIMSTAKNFEPVRDVPVGSVSIKTKDEAIPDKLNGAPKKLFQCSKCQKTFQTMIHFRYHVCSVKTGPSTTCNLCGHESTSAKDLRAHWRMHQRQRRVAATALWELQASEGISNNCSAQEDDSSELQCERCGKMYKKCHELIHIAMHEEEPPYRCKKCSETFDAKDKLSRHMRSHREQKTHVCLYCGKTFTDSNAFKLHVRSHTGEKPFECTYCGKTFSRPYERMKHERIHTGERPHVCEICGKTFRVSYCLTLHKRTHSGDRPYCCDICGKRFKAHSAYKHHVQIHSEERNYKCPYCPKAFKTMVHLAGHKKTHTKPFSCTECNRRFASLYSVKAHMESHKTGDNRFRYRCFVCGASYARAFALQYHMQTHGPCDAPEDVAEVLEICEEQDIKKEQSLSELEEEEYIESKDVDDLGCVSIKASESVNS